MAPILPIFFHWRCKDPAFIKNMASLEKHFKYLDKPGKWKDCWLLLGAVGSSVYDIMIKMGDLASPVDMEKHSMEYHRLHGQVNEKTRKIRRYAYFIEEVIVLNPVLKLTLHSNAFPLPVKDKDIIKQLEQLISSGKNRSFFCRFLFTHWVLLG